jgi:predicted house-cleaning noncanonical NTP pyrophosphatase (MazG superfamily)
MREFNKLVRDRIVEDIEAEGRTVEHCKLQGEELFKAFLNKIMEEAEEINTHTDRENLVEEVGDLYDVLDSFVQHVGIEIDVELSRIEKCDTLGRFDGGYKLIRTS